MSAKQKRMIVLALGQKDKTYGRGGVTFPQPLIDLVISSGAKFFDFEPAGIVAYYMGSRRTVGVLKRAISQAEGLRESDAHFSKLGIGLAYGHLVGRFDWLRKLKSDFVPDAGTVSRALAGVRGEQIYGQILQELHANTR